MPNLEQPTSTRPKCLRNAFHLCTADPKSPISLVSPIITELGRTRFTRMKGSTNESRSSSHKRRLVDLSYSSYASSARTPPSLTSPPEKTSLSIICMQNARQAHTHTLISPHHLDSFAPRAYQAVFLQSFTSLCGGTRTCIS